MQGESATRQRWELVREHLNERQRRVLAAAEAKVIGRGGVAQVAAATGLARDTISAGPQELDAPHSEFMGGFVAASLGVVRRSGGGRKSTALKDPSLVPDLVSLVNPTTRGDPQSALRWSCKSLRVLADELKRLEHNVSHVRVGQLLKAQGYSLQGNAKVIEGNQSPTPTRSSNAKRSDGPLGNRHQLIPQGSGRQRHRLRCHQAHPRRVPR